MNQLLDLGVEFIPPPQDMPSKILATFTLRCDQLGLFHSGDLLHEPLTPQERRDLQWYLEEYWMWPYEGFAQHGKEVEQLLVTVGQRLYQILFGSAQAADLVRAWRLQGSKEYQISIISTLPAVLSLPWELLHDGENFLLLHADHPVSIVRRLPLNEQVGQEAAFAPPLRILLITSQPERTGFVDPRSIARELFDELGSQIEAGAIELEFLRPPTLAALQTRLRKRKRPVHILHFDGHGTFGAAKQGMLAFEDEEGRLDAVKAETLTGTLQDSGVHLVILTACQSAMSTEENIFSSVAAQLIGRGVAAVVAMSTNVLVTSATRYTEAFYHALAAGIPVSIAHEQARQALYNDPRRHLHHRHQDEEGKPIELRDWWMPHLYLQYPMLLQPTQPVQKRKKQKKAITSLRLNEEMPGESRYGFFGRARELRKLERWLLQRKIVMISGFGGIGKTALAREAADWLTHTKMYDRACFISFEHGGDAAMLLSTLGHFLGVYDGYYDPNKSKLALDRLQLAFKKQRTLVIADNLESILPEEEASLKPEIRAQLWDVLLQLSERGAGVLLTSRDTALKEEEFIPGSGVAYLVLQGLRPDDAYTLASRLLDTLGIDPIRAPYAELRDLLAQLDHHPLAIQLVLPALRDMTISAIRTEFAALLPKFIDESEAGRNRSLSASLEYSLQQLSEEQRNLLSRLAPFEGGASEDDLLAITEIPKSEWANLLPVLEQSALVIRRQVHTDVPEPFLHFHPVLTFFLRGQLHIDDVTLRRRYTQHYHMLAYRLHFEDLRHPRSVRSLARRQLPNFRRVIGLLLEAGEVNAARDMLNHVARFLTIFGLRYENDELRRRVIAATPDVQKIELLTTARYQHESGLGEDELRKGNIPAARAHFTVLLEYFERQTEGDERYRRGSYAHCATLHQLARCSELSGKLVEAGNQLNEALIIIDELLDQQPELQNNIRERGVLLADLGGVLLAQGEYLQAQQVSEEALKIVERVGDLRMRAIVLAQLGMLAVEQQEYTEARSRYLQVLARFRALSEPEMEAVAWYQLGIVAEKQKEWVEAERCYRNSLAIWKRMGDEANAADTCSQLAFIAEESGRPLEAEAWHKQALELDEQVHPGSFPHARHLSNFADLLLQEVEKGHRTRERINEARVYAGRALEILETLDASSEIWVTLSILARIADLDESIEVARDYRRRERETFAAFEGNRYSIDQEHEFLMTAIASAVENPEIRATIEAALQKYYEVKGWHITLAVKRLWAGERDWYQLTEGLDRQDSLLILRILEILALFTDP